MKKKLLCLMCFLFVFAVSGCQKDEEKVNMGFYPSEFGEETTKIINTYNKDMAYLDYSIDDSVKKVTMQIYFCIDGKWETAGALVDDKIENEGRIVFEANKYYIELYSNGGGGTFENKIPNEIFKSGYFGLGYKLDKLQDIKLNEEITVFIQINKKGDKMEANELVGKITEIEADYGYAIGVTFS